MVKAAVVAVVVTIAVTVTAGAVAVALGTSLSVTSSVMAGAAIGSASGSTGSGCASVISAEKNSSTELLVPKGLQAGVNMLISNTAYITECCISGQDMSLYGATIANLSGFISGATFNASATNGEDLITIFK